MGVGCVGAKRADIDPRERLPSDFDAFAVEPHLTRFTKTLLSITMPDSRIHEKLAIPLHHVAVSVDMA